MNGLQHLTTPTSLKFCLALCYSSGPNSSKFGPSCHQVDPNFFHLAKRDGDYFFRARANPELGLNACIMGENIIMQKVLVLESCFRAVSIEVCLQLFQNIFKECSCDQVS